MRLRSLVGLTVVLALGGCDAWPTVVNNRTENPIKLQYRAEGHSEWSGTFPVGAGKAQRLAREHWVQGMLGLRIQERGKIYELSFKDLLPVREGCPSDLLARRFKFAADCYVDYLGEGRLHSSYNESQGLTLDH
jgi:hypothetical protein